MARAALVQVASQVCSRNLNSLASVWLGAIFGLLRLHYLESTRVTHAGVGLGGTSVLKAVMWCRGHRGTLMVIVPSQLRSVTPSTTLSLLTFTWALYPATGRPHGSLCNIWEWEMARQRPANFKARHLLCCDVPLAPKALAAPGPPATLRPQGEKISFGCLDGIET